MEIAKRTILWVFLILLAEELVQRSRASKKRVPIRNFYQQKRQQAGVAPPSFNPFNHPKMWVKHFADHFPEKKQEEHRAKRFDEYGKRCNDFEATDDGCSSLWSGKTKTTVLRQQTWFVDQVEPSVTEQQQKRA